LKQLQLTYRPDEVPSKNAKSSDDEPEPPPSDDVIVSNVEILFLQPLLRTA
jgi:hypothetical protein